MPIRIADLTDAAAVNAALREFDELGRTAFLEKYGYHEAYTYFLERDGRRYDSKAIAGVAYGIQHPKGGTPTPADFSGGEQTVAPALRQLGFRIVESAPPATLLSKAEVESVLDEWDGLGRDAFLRLHDVEPAKRYVIERNGIRYDAKAVVAVAHRAKNPAEPPIQSGDFRGDASSIRRPLEALGFTIRELDSSSPVSRWELEPGDTIRRVELHDRYGGQRQGGIGPSRQTPNVLIFSDPGTGEQHGYFDRWEADDEFHYAGEGQRGNQTLERGNGAILNHRDEGRALRVFWGAKGTVEYAGEFELDSTEPYYWVDAPETDGGPLRKVVMFRLRPLGTPTVTDPTKPARRILRPPLATPYRPVDPTKCSAPRDPFEVDPDAVDRGLRGHAQTQELLAELARAHGHEPLSPGGSDPNFDLAWRTVEGVTVVEVKSLTGANEAGQIRLGLGQVLDYQHRLEWDHDQVQAVLALERAPIGEHWASLCGRHGVQLVWPDTFPTIFDGAP